MPGRDRAAQRGSGEAARGNLDARVEHCPDWSVGDLVWHVTGVQWFWARIAQDLPVDRPVHLMEEENRPARPGSEDDLLALFRATTADLVGVLGRADQAAPCWTWAPQQDVAFITGHQVQEALVHHWDAAHARGREVTIDPATAIDAVEEFLTVSVTPTPLTCCSGSTAGDGTSSWPKRSATPPCSTGCAR